MVRAIKKEVLAVNPKYHCCYNWGDDFEVGKFGNDTITGYIPELIYTISGKILTDTENSDEIRY